MAEKFEIEQTVKIIKNDFDLNNEFTNLGFLPISYYLSGDTGITFSGDSFIGSFYLAPEGYYLLANYYLDNTNQFNGTISSVLTNSSLVSL